MNFLACILPLVSLLAVTSITSPTALKPRTPRAGNLTVDVDLWNDDACGANGVTLPPTGSNIWPIGEVGSLPCADANCGDKVSCMRVRALSCEMMLFNLANHCDAAMDWLGTCDPKMGLPGTCVSGISDFNETANPGKNSVQADAVVC